MGDQVKSGRSIQDELFSAIENGNFESVENLWIDVVSEVPTEADFYDRFIRAMRRAKALDRAHELLLLALDELEAKEFWKTKLEVLRIAARFWPDSKPLRPHTARALKQVYKDIPQLPDMIAACKGLPLDRVFARFDEFFTMMPGEVYSHPYWGDGIVRELDVAQDRVVLEFPESEEKFHTITMEFLRKHLTHRPDGTFTARLIKTPDQLREMAEEDPSGLVKLVLEERGGRLKQSDLKALLLDRLISEPEWARWWQRARADLRVNPWIDFDGSRGAHSEIVLRKEPRTFEQELVEAYFAPDATLAQRNDAMRELIKAGREGSSVSEEALAKIRDDLTNRIRTGERSAEKLWALSVLSQLAEVFPQQAESSEPELPSEEELLSGIEDYSELFEQPDTSLVSKALRFLFERDGEKGREKAAELIVEAPVVFAQAVWNELHPENHAALAVRALRELFERSLDNPETYVWAVRNLVERRWKHLDDYIPLSALIFDLLDALDQWDAFVNRASDAKNERVQRAKWLIGKVRSLISAGEFAVIGEAVRDMSREEVQELQRTLQLHNVFTDSARTIAERCIRRHRRDLEEQQKQASPVLFGESGVHYCTAKGLAQAMKELHELNTVKIPENAKEIEKARSEGDLRENAGYHGAREKHALLLQTAHLLQHAISNARVITKEEVDTSSVRFGTTVVLQNLDTGKEEQCTLLGQWESDVERGIYNYKAPFPQQLLGKTVGEEFSVTFPDGRQVRYRVLSIFNALASGEWDEESK